MSQARLGFLPEPITIALERILPSRKVPDGVVNSRKFEQIKSSIDAVGLIEPLSIGVANGRSGEYVLLDGHIRWMALKALGFEDAPCLVATDDETYTYNNRVNRLSSVQEHLMIQRAVARGVTPEKLAKALAVDVNQIVAKMNLLDGVCAEAAELLKDQQFSPAMGAVLRKLKPLRQVECVELMLSTNNITVAYARAILAATPSNQLVGDTKPKKMAGVSPEQMAKMEREMDNLHGQYKLVEQSYGQDVLNLVLAAGFIGKLLENKAVSRYLSQRQPDVLAEFATIVQTVSLGK